MGLENEGLAENYKTHMQTIKSAKFQQEHIDN